MKAVLGLKSHSGWAALVVLGAAAGDLHVIDRRRIQEAYQMQEFAVRDRDGHVLGFGQAL